MRKKLLCSGFSLIEILVVIGITFTLLGFITINLLNTQHTSTLKATVQTVISDIKSQQIKSMTGATEGRTQPDQYGIFFSANSYTLFHGSTYTSSDPTNFVITINPSLQFTNITFSKSSLIFSELSGEVASYSAGQNSVALEDISTKVINTITFNRYGDITAVQ